MSSIYENVNNTEKVNFPGYQPKTSNVNKPDKKPKCSLPPFLMMRAGLLNNWWLALFTGAALAASISIPGNPKDKEFAYITLGPLLAITVGWAIIFTKYKKTEIQDRTKALQEEVNSYLKYSNATFDITSTNEYKKLDSILIKYLSNKNPGMFDKLIQKPDSVKSENVAESILIGHLKKHPADAQKIMDTFRAETMPNKLYRRTNRYVTRLSNNIKSR